MTIQSREDAVRKTINSHGFGFQEAVIESWRTAGPIAVGGLGRHWKLCDREVPVEAAGRDYRVDAIFQLTPDVQTRLYAVLETKRPRADMSDWVFARSTALGTSATETFHKLRHAPRSIFIGSGSPTPPSEPRLSASPQWLSLREDAIFDVGFERKAPTKKDDSDCCLGKALDSAVEQVLRGLVGTVEQLPDWLPEQMGALLIPTIVTNATLWCVADELRGADIASGDLPNFALTSRPWVWLQQQVSRSMVPSASRNIDLAQSANPIAERNLRLHRRGIMIIDARHLNDGISALAGFGEALLPMRRLE